MKIIFLNIWNCEVEIPVIEFIKEHSQDTDVFCFQEAEAKTKEICSNILKDYELVQDYKFINSHDTFPQATYVKKSVKILSSETYLANDFEVGLGLHTELEKNGKSINICNVHGISTPGDKLDNPARLRQSRGIIDGYSDKSSPRIIGGDFNLDFGTQSVGLFEQNGYRNLIKEYKIETTRNRLIWEKFPNSKQYFADYAFVDPSIKIKNFSVPQNEISDHLPMILDVEL